MSYARMKKKLRRMERRELLKRTFQIRALVDRILLEEFDRQIFRLSKLDGYRLLTLWVWQQRYHVSIRFMLKKLVPYYLKAIEKRHRVSKNSLGIRIQTLVGKRSEELVREAIQQEYPNQEHIGLWLWNQRRKILSRRELEQADEFQIRSKSILDYRKPEAYVRAYRRRMAEEKKAFEKQCQSKSNRLRPYRGNPFV